MAFVIKQPLDIGVERYPTPMLYHAAENFWKISLYGLSLLPYSSKDRIMSASHEDEIRFERLFRDNYQRLYLYALDWVEDEEQAKDIVGTLMSDLWAKRDRWHPDNEMAYMYGALRNRCISHLKKNVRYRETLEVYLQEKLCLIDEDIDVHEENLARMEQIMEALSPRTRLIVEKCYLEGCKYKEVAELLDTTPGMIHKHISKALAIFRKKFLHRGGTD